MFNRFKMGIILLLVVLVLFPAGSRSLEDIKKSGVLYAGFTETAIQTVNYEFARIFAGYLGVELVVVKHDWDECFSFNGSIPADIKTNADLSYTPDIFQRADVICNTLLALEWRTKLFEIPRTIESTELLIVPENSGIHTKEDLAGKKISALEKSSYDLHLKEISNSLTTPITLVKVKSNQTGEELLLKGEIDALPYDADKALDFVKENPGYKIIFPIGPLQDVGWGVDKQYSQLQDEIERFFKAMIANASIDSIFKERYGISYAQYLTTIHAHHDSSIKPEYATRDLEDILADGKITIALRDRDLVYHPNGPKQFCHALVEEFAQYLGVEPEFVYTPSFSKYWENKQGEILKDESYIPEWFNHFDLAAEVITKLDWRDKKVDIIGVLPDVNIVVAKKGTVIKSIEDLKKLRGVTVKGSIYEEILLNNGITNFYYDTTNRSIPSILEGKADYALITSLFSFLKYPELESKLVVGDIGEMGWALRKNQPALKAKIYEFMEHARKSGLIDKLYKNQSGMSLNEATVFLKFYQQSVQKGHYPFVYYGIKDGLIQEDVLAIFQDRIGNIWLGTHAGAVRYNGKRMEQVNTASGLSSNSVFDIQQDQDGALYFATANGINRLADRKLVTMFSGISFHKIFIDRHNNKWFLGESGIYVVTKDNKKIYLNDVIPDLPNMVHDITQDEAGIHTLIASSSGLFYIEGFKSATRLIDAHCRSVFVDNTGNIWLSTGNGMYLEKLSRVIKARPLIQAGSVNSGLFKRYLNDILFIPDVVINDISMGRDGSIWLLSDNAIFQVMNLDHIAIQYDTNKGLKNYPILSFIEDREGNLWFGFSGGIQKLTNRSLRIFYPDYLDNYIYSFFEDNNKRIWICSDNGIYYYKYDLINFHEKLPVTSKKTLGAVLPDGNILIANREGLFVIDVNTLKIIKRKLYKQALIDLTSIYVQPDGTIYITSGREGLLYYLESIDSDVSVIENTMTANINQLVEFESRMIAGNQNKLISFDKKAATEIYKLNSNINTIYKTFKKSEIGEVLYLGTENGLRIYRDGNSEFYDIHIPGNSVTTICEAHDKNYLWLGSKAGFSYYNTESKQVEFSLNYKDGLPGNEITQNGLFIDSNGFLWIGTYHGVAIFDIGRLNTEKYPPVCYIERILLNGEELYKQNKDKYKHNENNFSFEITGLSFRDEKSIIYDFSMNGLKDEYTAASGKTSVAYYPNLLPGEYTFKYRAKGKDNIWSDYKSFQFHIQKPIWQRIWFQVLIILVAIVIIYLIISIRLMMLQKKNDELEKLVMERTLEIREEKEKSDKLLLNILPAVVADELKTNGRTYPKTYDNVTVYFSDLVGFTRITSSMDPDILVYELNEIFTDFDNIMEKHKCERIKTIGDAYLAVCGMPAQNEYHAENIVNASLEIIDYINHRNTLTPIKWKIRIGIHTGKVIGSVIGVKKYIYDVFGDTINTASRLETNSEPMRINISETTCDILKNSSYSLLTPLKFTERDQVDVKGKGSMRMFFVNRLEEPGRACNDGD